MSAADLAAYGQRIGRAGPLKPDLETLRRLHRAHLEAIPFENSSVVFGERIGLDPAAHVQKLGRDRRGGFCYELNGAFAELLRDVGFEVTYLEAAVHGSAALGNRFEHLALRVELEEPWLADVGFGYSFVEPLRLLDRGEQLDPMGAFRLVDREGRVDVEWRHRDGRWVAHYQFDPEPQPLDAFAAECERLQVAPDSPFVTGWMCSRIWPGGGATLFGSSWIWTRDEARDERTLTDDETVEVLAREFNVRARRQGERWLPALFD